MKLTGKILIAPPSVKGNFWQNTVIFVHENHTNGSCGIVINKKSQLTIRNLASQHGIESDIIDTVQLGGPVNAKALTLLHSSEWACENTLKVNKHFAISSADSILHRLTLGDRPNYWRLALGLCTWGPDQLENEINGKSAWTHSQSWLIADPTTELLFKYNAKEQWTKAIEKSSEDFVQNLLA